MKHTVVVQLLPHDLERDYVPVGSLDFFTQQEPHSGLVFFFNVCCCTVPLPKRSLRGFAGGGRHQAVLFYCSNYFCFLYLCFFFPHLYYL